MKENSMELIDLLRPLILGTVSLFVNWTKTQTLFVD